MKITPQSRTVWRDNIKNIPRIPPYVNVKLDDCDKAKIDTQARFFGPRDNTSTTYFCSTNHFVCTQISQPPKTRRSFLRAGRDSLNNYTRLPPRRNRTRDTYIQCGTQRARERQREVDLCNAPTKDSKRALGLSARGSLYCLSVWPFMTSVIVVRSCFYYSLRTFFRILVNDCKILYV